MVSGLICKTILTQKGIQMCGVQQDKILIFYNNYDCVIIYIFYIILIKNKRLACYPPPFHNCHILHYHPKRKD